MCLGEDDGQAGKGGITGTLSKLWLFRSLAADVGTRCVPASGDRMGLSTLESGVFLITDIEAVDEGKRTTDQSITYQDLNKEMLC